MILKSSIVIENQYIMNIINFYCGKLKCKYKYILIFVICKLLKKIGRC
jgi:hypothetical protein